MAEDDSESQVSEHSATPSNRTGSGRTVTFTSDTGANWHGANRQSSHSMRKRGASAGADGDVDEHDEHDENGDGDSRSNISTATTSATSEKRTRRRGAAGRAEADVSLGGVNDGAAGGGGRAAAATRRRARRTTHMRESLRNMSLKSHAPLPVAAAAATDAAGGAPASLSVDDLAAAAAAAENVRVMIRLRPLNTREVKLNSPAVVVAKGQTLVAVTAATSKAHNAKSFEFDRVFDSETQSQVFEEVVVPMLGRFVSGYHACIFCYGQTGSGKTWTMLGSDETPDTLGFVPRSLQRVFEYVDSRRSTTRTSVTISALEIYNEGLNDLTLAADSDEERDCSLHLRETADDGVYVQNLRQIEVSSVEDATVILERALESRVIGETNMNARSSRSHLVFSLRLVQRNLHDDLGVTEKTSILHMVDLAGSERADTSGARGERLREGANINLSLSCLGKVINALVTGQGHVPFRESKLTRMLQNSLGGNSSTLMLANISPAEVNVGDTLSTLRFAERAKKIQNNAKINLNPAHARLRELMAENERLRARVQQLELQLKSAAAPSKKSRVCAIM